MTEYITINDTVSVLAEIGIDMKLRQIQRAAEPDVHGQRRLPFFKDPIDGCLKIERQTLIGIYQSLNNEAIQSCKLELELT